MNQDAILIEQLQYILSITAGMHIDLNCKKKKRFVVLL